MKWPSICKCLMYTSCTLKLDASNWYDMIKLLVPVLYDNSHEK